MLPVQVSDFPVTIIYGGPGGGPEPVLHSVVDGAFLHDDNFPTGGIAILDASAPWLRVYTSDGQYVRGIVGEGRGPGEARAPHSMSQTKGGFRLFQQGRFLEVTSDGEHVTEIVDPAFLRRGEIRACGGRRFVFGAPIGQGLVPPGKVLREGGAQGHFDTILITSRYRWQPRLHPLFAVRTAEGILLYPEEFGNDHLVEIACSGEVLRRVAVDSLGLPEIWERTENALAAHPPTPPYPAGVGWTSDVILWAVRDTLPGGSPVTMLTGHDEAGGRRGLTLAGWFVLLDSDVQGRLLLAGEDPVPAVYIITAGDLLAKMTRLP